MIQEIFKAIPNYEGFYEASNFGNIRSLPRGKRGKAKILKPTKQTYYSVDLCKNGEIKRYLVHRLVASAFLNNPYNKEQVNHIDGNKLNNNVKNLEWATRSENQKHAIYLGLRTAKGIKNSQHKINEECVLKILHDKRLFREIALEYNISITTVSNIKTGYSWNHITKIGKNRKQVLRIK